LTDCRVLRNPIRPTVFPLDTLFTRNAPAVSDLSALGAVRYGWPRGCLTGTRERGDAVTQRWIEIVIGKLVTDAALRNAFLRAPRDTLLGLVEQGMHLTPAEIAALVAIDGHLWTNTARRIDLTSLQANPDNE